MKPLILTFDCGTQSVRALLFDNLGNLLAMHRICYAPYFSQQPGWAEQYADFYWEKICEASRALQEEQPELWKCVAAVTMTTMRDTSVNLDEHMRPLRPCILWCDQRSAKCEQPLPKLHNAAFALAGMTECVKASRQNTKSNWIRENQPELWEKTRHYPLLSGYLIYKLTGELVDSVASQVGHIPLDYRHKTWMQRSHLKYLIFNVEREKLPPLVEPGETLGCVTQQAAGQTGIPAGTRVIATGSDKGCETLGAGGARENVASLSFGTTATVQLTTKKYVEPQQFLPAYPSVLPGYYNPEIEIYRGYWMLSWFIREFAHEERQLAEREGVSVEAILDRHLSEVPPGSDGLVLQPYWGAGLKNPEAKGAIVGFSDVHTRVHLYRAIIEGVNYALRDSMETVARRAGVSVCAVTVSGGGSQSDAICQITADMFALPVLRAQTHETAGLGSSIVGFVGLGEYASVQEAAAQMVRNSSFEPNGDQEVYDRLYREVYRNVYPRLKPFYRRIRRILE